MIEFLTNSRLPALWIFVFVLVDTSQAQVPLNASQWIFGKEVWVDMSVDTPVVRRAPGFLAMEPSTSYSDSSGQLVWYCDAHAVYNRNHQVLAHGELYDTLLQQNFSWTQGVLALPDPAIPDRSYVLFLGGDYAVIDHNLDGGLGDIVGPPFLKNWYDSSVPSGGSEKLNAIRHANGRDWWVLTILSDGLSGAPKAPKLGVSLLGPQGLRFVHDVELGLPIVENGLVWAAGELKVSPKGDRIVFSGLQEQGVRLYEFDRCTGMPGQAIDSVFFDTWAYSLEFSPSGELIYIGETTRLWQWRPDDGQKSSSLVLLEDVPPLYWFSGLKRQQDKVYVFTGQTNPPTSVFFTETTFNKNLSIIENPDAIGLACSLVPFALNMDTGVVIWGAPNLANYSLGALEGSPCDTLSGSSTAIAAALPEAEVVLHPNPSHTVWNIGGLASGVYRFTVYDAVGREVLRGEWREGTRHVVSASSLPSGWYGVRVEQHGRLVWRGTAIRR
jgi:hypothetical protein